MNRKVYDYKPEAVRERLVRAFRDSRGEATTADLVARTGLPVHQVETEVRAVADEYGARLRVAESGDLLWSFPRGMASRYRGLGPGLRKAWRAFKKGAAAVGTFLFKAWIVVMLVGYFVLFVALALLALAASVAASASNKDQRRGRSRDGGGGLFLVGRVLDLFIRVWFYSEFLKSPQDRQRQSERRRSRKPLYHAVFSFVFGDGDPAAGRDAAIRRAFAAHVRARKGTATAEELVAMTGLPPAAAEELMNRLAYELEGSPEVSAEGTVYWTFPALMRAAAEAGSSADPGPVPLRKFSANPTQANAWFSVFNGVNLAFGSYFLYSVLSGAPLGNPDTGFTFYGFVAALAYQVGLEPFAALGIGLGAVPVSFALLFWSVPAVRWLRLKAENARRAAANLRRRVARAVLADPSRVDPASLAPRGAEEAGEPAKLVEELAAAWGADPAEGGAWRFDEIGRRVRDLQGVRAAVDESRFALGKSVFDTDS